MANNEDEAADAFLVAMKPIITARVNEWEKQYKAEFDKRLLESQEQFSKRLQESQEQFSKHVQESQEQFNERVQESQERIEKRTVRTTFTVVASIVAVALFSFLSFYAGARSQMDNAILDFNKELTNFQKDLTGAYKDIRDARNLLDRSKDDLTHQDGVLKLSVAAADKASSAIAQLNVRAEAQIKAIEKIQSDATRVMQSLQGQQK